jgi:circadian clock protein KaiC
MTDERQVVTMAPAGVEHVPTGIDGFDLLTNGGLPRDRTSLVAGGPGCGKTLFGLSFLLNGVAAGEPGVCITFEESPEDLAANAGSIGYDFAQAVRDGHLEVDHVILERDHVTQTGAYDLDGLLVRLQLAIDTVGAERVLIDTPEVLFAELDDSANLRSELRRLFQWLNARGVTSIVTAEKGEGSLTRHGLEEYVSDCVILLDHRVDQQLATRRLRIVKFRSSSHGMNEYPFLIDEHGFSVVPITSFDLSYASSMSVVSTGVADLDEMLARKGVFEGSTTMVSGRSGTGKTSFSAAFVEAACTRGETALFLAFEESRAQIVRNMSSIGLDLGRWIDAGRLHLEPSRPTQAGLEGHLAVLHRHVEDVQPDVVVLDPITDFQALGSTLEIKAMLMRMVDYLKQRGVTTMFTSLSSAAEREDPTVSSLIDTWIQLDNESEAGQLERTLFVRKSRGMAHSGAIRSFLLTDDGIRFEPPGGGDGAGGRRGSDRR